MGPLQSKPPLYCSDCGQQLKQGTKETFMGDGKVYGSPETGRNLVYLGDQQPDRSSRGRMRLYRCGRGLLTNLLLERVRLDEAEAAAALVPQQQRREARSFGPGRAWHMEGAAERRRRRALAGALQRGGVPSLAALCAHQIGVDIDHYARAPPHHADQFRDVFTSLPPSALDAVSRAASARALCDDAAVALLARPHATVLTLVGCCGDEAVTLLAAARTAAAAEAAPASWEDVADAPAPELSGCPYLEELDLSSAKVSVRFLEALARSRAPRLRRLALSGCAGVAADGGGGGAAAAARAMRALASFGALQELDLSRCAWCDDLAVRRLACLLAAQKAAAAAAAAEATVAAAAPQKLPLPPQGLQRPGVGAAAAADVDDDGPSAAWPRGGDAAAAASAPQQAAARGGGGGGGGAPRTGGWPLELYCADAGVTQKGAEAAAALADGALRIIC
ncbi:hypothetical protein JKP88DRAFT_298267 [Tribonema minus]|uniref:Uncharacterized protein n=1 Tax=Tribonema minus TaxID=303371 RepID=A0A835ZKF0_9STRA|nr:hypothetical protein JKP88DRAFT_298267 [Tribonema minus]